MVSEFNSQAVKDFQVADQMFYGDAVRLRTRFSFFCLGSRSGLDDS